MARLALPPLRPFGRDELCRLLWPDDTPAASREVLRAELTRLRRSLGEAADIVHANRSQVWLDPDAVTTDLGGMLQALETASKTRDLNRRIQALQTAVTVNADSLLLDLEEPWIQAERRRYRELRTSARAALAKLLEDAGRVEEAEATLQDLMLDQPSSEQAALAAIGFFHRAGRPSRALEQYGVHESALRDELGVRPSDQVRVLVTKARTTVSAPEAPSQLGMPPSNLPAPISHLVGRTEELGQIERLITSGDRAIRLLTLTGPGGVGKTRLVLEVGRNVRPLFSGRVWFVPLAGLDDPTSLGDVLLDQLGIERHGAADAWAVLRNRVGTDPALLILDNFEQLVNGGSAIVKQLLEEIASLKVLVTSRASLELEGERFFSVSPLGHGDDASPAVELFLQAANTVSPQPLDDAESRQEVLKIVNRLEGLPLAIHLAAAKTAVFTPKEILSQLEDRFALLVSSRAELGGRHESIEAAIAWSYKLLSADLKSLFLELSVFRGGWTRDLADSLRGESTLQASEQLRRQSLVQTYPTPYGMRFRMLETVREFGIHQLSSDQKREIQARHLRALLDFAQCAYVRYQAIDQLDWYRRVDLELDNMRAALSFAAEQDPASGQKLCIRLARFWHVRSHHVEARHWLDRMLSADLPPSDDRAFLHFWMARFCQEQRDYANALAAYERAHRVADALGDESRRCLLWMNEAETYNDLGEYAKAGELALKSATRQLDAGHGGNASYALDEVARSELGQGRIESALKYARQMLALREQFSDLMSVSYGRLVIATVFVAAGQPAAARREAEDALEAFRSFGSFHGAAAAQVRLAEIDIHEGNREVARERIEECRLAYNAIGDKAGLDMALALLND